MFGILACLLLLSGAAFRARTFDTVPDPTETDFGQLYGTCPTDNAVCVVIRMRNPRASDDCKDSCDAVAAKMTTRLQPGEDENFPSGCGRCMAVDSVVGGKKRIKHWAFDVIFPYDDLSQSAVPNTDVYHAVVKPLVDEAFGKYGGCKSAALFAYGASGSGKSFTMGFEPGKKDGLLQMGAARMFENLLKLQESGHVLGHQQVHMAYYEIYGDSFGGEKVFDLLAAKRTGVRGSYNTVVTALTFKPVSSLDSLMEVFEEGNRHRAVGSTGMNDVSSRSHALVQLVISEKPISEFVRKIAAGEKKERTELLTALSRGTHVTFVDLAGSEPAAKWEDEKRKAEGKVINQALSSLRNCIASAADPKLPRCSTRSNMLTEMLKDLFAIDPKTKKAKAFARMIATVNPSADPLQISHTQSTMTYASTVKSIKISSPVGHQVKAVNVLPEQVIAQLKTYVASLEARNEQLEKELHTCTEEKPTNPIRGAKVPDSVEEIPPTSDEVLQLRIQLQQKKDEIQRLAQQLNAQTEASEMQMTQALADLKEKEQEVNLCGDLLSESDVSRNVLQAQNKQLLSTENTHLEEMERLKSDLADCRASEGGDTQQVPQREEQKCKLLELSGVMLGSWEEKYALEEKSQEMVELHGMQEKREQLLQKLRMLQEQGGGVTFSAWLGEMLVDLLPDVELGPVQRRLLDTAKATAMVTEKLVADDLILQQLRMEMSGILQRRDQTLQSQLRPFEELAKDEAAADTVLQTFHAMRKMLSEVVEPSRAQAIAVQVTEMEKQMVISICFARKHFLKAAHDACPDLAGEETCI